MPLFCDWLFLQVIFSKRFSGYEAIERQTTNDYYVFQDDQSQCSSGRARYKWSLSQGNHYGVSDEFAAAVCSLPLTYDAQIYKDFLDAWGTVICHYFY